MLGQCWGLGDDDDDLGGDSLMIRKDNKEEEDDGEGRILGNEMNIAENQDQSPPAGHSRLAAQI